MTNSGKNKTYLYSLKKIHQHMVSPSTIHPEAALGKTWDSFYGAPDDTHVAGSSASHFSLQLRGVYSKSMRLMPGHQ